MKKINLPAFTLVELIVVITIVGILSTIGFVSYSGYLTGARDSNRISQLTKLSDSLQVYSASKTLPLPDDKIDITASGTLIAHQGYVGVDVLETIDYTNGGKDPKDDSYYTYYLTKDRKSLQLMALMEEQQSVASIPNTSLNSLLTGEMQPQVNANYEERYPKVYGRKLGVLTYSDDTDITLFNTPAQEISQNTTNGALDIVLTGIIYTANITDLVSDKITGTGSNLMAMNHESSCKRIKQTGGNNGSGIYTISPQGEDINVYCDMETEGGGWTLVFIAKGADLENLSEIHPLAHMQSETSLYHVSNEGSEIYPYGGISNFSLGTTRDKISDQKGSSRNMVFTLIETFPYYTHIYWERWIPSGLSGREEYVSPGFKRHNIYQISEEINSPTNMNFLSHNRYQGQGWDFTLRSNTASYPDRVVGSYITAPSGEKFLYDRCQGCRGHYMMNPGPGTDGFFLERTYGNPRIWDSSYNSQYVFNSTWDEYDNLLDGDSMPGWGMYVR